MTEDRKITTTKAMGEVLVWIGFAFALVALFGVSVLIGYVLAAR